MVTLLIILELVCWEKKNKKGSKPLCQVQQELSVLLEGSYILDNCDDAKNKINFLGIKEIGFIDINDIPGNQLFDLNMVHQQQMAYTKRKKLKFLLLSFLYMAIFKYNAKKKKLKQQQIGRLGTTQSSRTDACNCIQCKKKKKEKRRNQSFPFK